MVSGLKVSKFPSKGLLSSRYLPFQWQGFLRICALLCQAVPQIAFIYLREISSYRIALLCLFLYAGGLRLFEEK
jgi:hypothetical protein